MTRSRTLIPIALGLALGVVVLTGCAPGPNVAASAGVGTPAGFWLGLWQGLICPITFFVSLFNDHVSIYEVHNNGNWYDFGYVLGLSVAFGGAWRGSRVPRRSRRP